MILSVLGLFAVAGAAPSANAAEHNYAAIVIDAKTGQVLFSRNADLQRYPASLTKMMTLYLVFEDLERGKISLNTRLSVSQNAANQAPSKLGVRPGSTIRVEDAILALVTKSANDVAVVIAENLSASVDAFADRMTRTARSLGMGSTTFRNPHGLPNSGQVTTARDMATLGQALRDRFPQYYGYFSTESFTWAGVTYGNHNNLLGDSGVLGIKTGYTSASGFNLVASVERDSRYIVAVVMGGNTSASRDAHMRYLISEYMPRASTGPRTQPLVVASPFDLIDVPLPRLNPVRSDPIMTAAIQPPPAAIGLAAEQGDLDPINQPLPPAPVAVASAPAASAGWAIQVGAVPSEAGAEAMLDRVAGLDAALLGSAGRYIEPVQIGNDTLYRARFVGFVSSDAAWAACSRLQAHSVDCYVPN